MKANERYGELVGIMTEVSGVDISTKGRSREFPVPLLRAMIAKRMHDEGYPYTHIGKAAERNHSTIISCIRTLQNILECPTASDRLILDIWREFREMDV